MKSIHRNRLAFLNAFAGLLLIGVVPAQALQPPRANDAKTVTVMTRNLYLGADVAPAVAAAATGNPDDLVAAVSQIWARVRFTDFPARAEGLAREIEQARPDLIGLQEAELWRTQTPADFVMGNAQDVQWDFVKILIEALNARGLRYAAVAEEEGFDIELPGFLSEADLENGLLSDIRLTEREVILARTDLKTSELKLSNAQTGHFQTIVPVPIPVVRGWVSVDAKVRGKSFRFISTHLEADDLAVRDAQALEVIAGPANTSLPVIFVADANSNANLGPQPNVNPAAYLAFIGAGFVDPWFEAHPGSFVSTCCNAELLTNATFPIPTDDDGRIDLILYRGAKDFAPLEIGLVGTNPTDRVFNGVALIWPSDHAGVAATLRITK